VPRYFEARAGILWIAVILGLLGATVGFLRCWSADEGPFGSFLPLPWSMVCIAFPTLWALGTARLQVHGPGMVVGPAIGIMAFLAAINFCLAGYMCTPGFSVWTALPVIYTGATVLALRRMKHSPNRDGADLLEEIRTCRALLEERKDRLHPGEVPLAFALEIILNSASMCGKEEHADAHVFPAIERLLRTLP